MHPQIKPCMPDCLSVCTTPTPPYCICTGREQSRWLWLMVSRQKPLLGLSLRCIVSHNALVPFTRPVIREDRTSWIPLKVQQLNSRLRLPSNLGRNWRRSGNFQSAFMSSHAPAPFPTLRSLNSAKGVECMHQHWDDVAALRWRFKHTREGLCRKWPIMMMSSCEGPTLKSHFFFFFLILLIINHLSYTWLFQIIYRERPRQEQVICTSKSAGWPKLLNGDLLTLSVDSQPQTRERQTYWQYWRYITRFMTEHALNLQDKLFLGRK